MDKVVLGIPCYGMQPMSWWGPLVKQTAEYYKQNIDLVDVLPYSTMMVDVSRNYIVDAFLKTDADWLKWLDADNVELIGSLRRLLDVGQKLVTGVYVKRQEKAEPVLYIRTITGEYEILEDFRPGEILPVDAAGMGCTLVHRSVYEDIKREYRMLDLATGGVRLFHRDDITDEIFDGMQGETDGKVISGVHHQRVVLPSTQKPFAFYILGDGRTEDYGFYECAARVGHQLWADTGVEVGHISEKSFEAKDWRKWKRQQRF